ncbi:MAG TPA: hypothetical protein VHX63_13260 [Acidobacteriaceae bacterium]|jgi:Na+/melibiose symporter-like transporter|nr:hypothetical protein [Acidobacteriaceae bacterium]
MFELFKLLWDVVVLRDAARKGQLMNWRAWVYGFGFALIEYGIALPAVMLYEKHPQYKPVFIAAMVLVVVNFICMMWWAWRWRARQSAP